MRSDDLIALTQQRAAHNYAPLPVVISRGEGAFVYDADGKRYLDMLSGYSALNFGHCHPRLVAAAERQLKKLTLTSRAFYSEEFALLSRDLAAFCGKDKVLIMNSGAEAVETAIKAARKWGYEKKKVAEDAAEILCFVGNFHGRTTTIVGFSSSEESRRGFGPFPRGFELVPYGDAAAVEAALTPNTVAILIEPILGEGGVIIPPDGFLRDVRDICTKHRVLMLADEVQTGLCRTGRIFACDHEEVVPDVYILGKSLGGGIVPISAIVANDEVMEVFQPGTHGSTFGGNPFACAIAREALDLIRESAPEKRAADFGDYMMTQLRQMNAAAVASVRGRGLLIGVDIKPEFGKAKDFCKKLIHEGVLSKDTRDQTIRFAPPLVISKADLDEGLNRIKGVFSS